MLSQVELCGRRNKGIEIHPFFGKHADELLTVVAGACSSTAHEPCNFGIGSLEALIAHLLTSLKVGGNFGIAGGNAFDSENGVSPEAIALDIFFIWSPFQQGGKNVFFCKFFGGIYLHLGTDFYTIITFGVVALVGGKFPAEFLDDVRQEGHSESSVKIHGCHKKDKIGVSSQVFPAFLEGESPHVKIGVDAVGFPGHQVHDCDFHDFPEAQQVPRSTESGRRILDGDDEAVYVFLGGLDACVLLHELLLLNVKMAILNQNRQFWCQSHDVSPGPLNRGIFITRAFAEESYLILITAVYYVIHLTLNVKMQQIRQNQMNLFQD